MATVPRSKPVKEIEYPTSDGRPMAETDVHRDLLADSVNTLKDFFTTVVDIYVSGNILLYYVEGDKRRHISPDVMVVKGVPKGDRLYYLLWKEGKAPQTVIELTSKTTRSEDRKKKFLLYQDILKVQEYFLFDPFEEYLKPSMQGYRLQSGLYVPIQPEERGLFSETTGLYLQREGIRLRFFDPKTGQKLLTRRERAAYEHALRLKAEAELEKVRQELEALRRRLNGGK